ncbi:unnamed protein product [Meloidogyne enterolobii]|uniref:Uncharacterized protein n=1 Tax=Meloidogyne enterolobii TaxID=390850 RepID=A0ACB0ZZS5_MELEN
MFVINFLSFLGEFNGSKFLVYFCLLILCFCLWLGEICVFVGFIVAIINIKSGQDNRTLTSAQLLLAGLFPSLNEQIWAEGERNLKEGEGYKRLEGLFKEEIERMEKDTQMKIDGIFILQRVLDSIVTRTCRT